MSTFLSLQYWELGLDQTLRELVRKVLETFVNKVQGHKTDGN